tara:strand:+ start:25572 stop:26408 length:837 start_codon:yes stop_codon:yes gene_type:complete
MQHILIPTDFSENAWNAIRYALFFFEGKTVTFHLLHIDITQATREDKYLNTAGIFPKRENTEELYEQLDKLEEKIYANFTNNRHTFVKVVVTSPFISGIREYVTAKNIRLIVMGTKGASGLKEITIGSKTGAVITKVKCPILVIPEEAKFKVPIHIGFPTDFNLLYKQSIINTLLKISEVHNTSIKVLRVAQTQQPLDEFQNRNRDFLKEHLKEVPNSFHVVENLNLENALEDFVTTMNIDVVAMIAKNLNFFQRILLKPKVARLSYHIKIPFLVLHE